jgi:hypothetical protein
MNDHAVGGHTFQYINKNENNLKHSDGVVSEHGGREQHMRGILQSVFHLL